MKEYRLMLIQEGSPPPKGILLEVTGYILPPAREKKGEVFGLTVRLREVQISQSNNSLKPTVKQRSPSSAPSPVA